MKKKAHRVVWSFALRLTVCMAGLALLAWQGRGFPRQLMGEESTAIRPNLPAIPHRWHIAVHPVPELPPPAHLVRVRLFADRTIPDLKLESVQGLVIGKHLLHGPVYVTRSPRSVIVTSDGLLIARSPTVSFHVLSEGTVLLRAPGKDTRRTLGEVRISVLPKGLEIVNVLDLEHYVLGTVEPELGGFDQPAEAIKAQIIASRSYVMALKDRHRGRDYDFCDTAHCLMFAGVNKYPPRFRKAAAQCRGVYLSYKGHPAAAFFHHGCGGETAAIEDVWPVAPVPYLRRVVDGNPAYCRLGRWAEWSFTIDRTSLRRALVARGWVHGNDALDSLRIVQKSPGGRAQQILIQTSRPRWVSANLFRQAINSYYRREVLYSTLFTITLDGQWVRVNGKGWGHGVGMCQSGAVHMAHEGFSCRAILAHYYPGTRLSQLADPNSLPLDTDAGARRELARLSY